MYGVLIKYRIDSYPTKRVECSPTKFSLCT
jgi:hypothetical protein